MGSKTYWGDTAHYTWGLDASLKKHRIIWGVTPPRKNMTCPDFQFLFVKKKIRTCPDFYLSIEYLKSGLVQISYLDVSRFEIFDGKFWIWTCPNFNFGHVQIFFFQLKIWNLDLSRYQFWTSDSHVKFHMIWKNTL